MKKLILLLLLGAGSVFVFSCTKTCTCVNNDQVKEIEISPSEKCSSRSNASLGDCS